jgi:hypothetical protein
MATPKDVIDLLLKRWQTAAKEREKIELEILELEKRKSELLIQQRGLLHAFDALGERPPEIVIPPELFLESRTSIGDVMESLIREHGPMTKADLITELQKVGKVKTKNARTLLANAIKRDGKDRFRVENGKVVLNEK